MPMSLSKWTSASSHISSCMCTSLGRQTTTKILPWPPISLDAAKADGGPGGTQSHPPAARPSHHWELSCLSLDIAIDADKGDLATAATISFWIDQMRDRRVLKT
eukprot:6027403-Pyramimonas_sp.AAC.1